MKKHLLLISTLGLSLISAQNNPSLQKKFEKENIENNNKFDSYVAKVYETSKSTKALTEIEKKRASLAGFDPSGRPFFLESQDMHQIKNSNSDFLQNGSVSGLSGSFNGENIVYTIFDGGRVFGGHGLFDNMPNRITNKEDSTMNYATHSTFVAGIVGAKDSPITLANGTIINPKGIAQNSKMNSYTYHETVLPGDSLSRSVFEKILIAQPKISNHSYGSNQGWDGGTVNGKTVWIWGGYFNSPNTSYDLQGTYYENDSNYDEIVYTNPSYIIVKTSGNYFWLGPERPGTEDFDKYYKDSAGNLVQFAATDTLPLTNCGSLGYDCTGPGSLAKNIIVVGATNIITSNDGRYTAPSDVVHATYSSAGPRDDGGIKPDITAVGTNVISANTAEDTTGSSGLTFSEGTSYSAPVVTGIIGLWTQINKQLFDNAELNAASAKTLMIHSAAEAGNVGPDPLFGWGFIDAKKGAELLVRKSNNTVIFNDEILNNDANNKKTIVASGTEPIKVTISWVDPEFKLPENRGWDYNYNNRDSRLVNDLDLRIIDTETGTAYLPWKLDPLSPNTAIKGDNTVDNVEQVIIDNPVAGRTYRIEITHKGTLVNNDTTPVLTPQNYSIIATGFSSFLGTTESKALSEIAMAPTITRDLVNVLKAPKKSIFTIYDLTGKKLQNGIINSDKESIDLSMYTKGIYIIEVKTGKEVISKKVIKE